MPKLVLEIKKPLRDNDILIYKDGEFIPCDVNTLFIKINREVKELKEEIANLKEEIKTKDAEQDKLIAKNAHDILVDRGLEDE